MVNIIKKPINSQLYGFLEIVLTQKKKVHLGWVTLQQGRRAYGLDNLITDFVPKYASLFQILYAQAYPFSKPNFPHSVFSSWNGLPYSVPQDNFRHYLNFNSKLLYEILSSFIKQIYLPPFLCFLYIQYNS